MIDEPQTDAVYGQWATNGSSAWKIPLLAKALSLLPFSGKPSTPWGPATVHDFMHAKVTIADDTVFVGSFNLSRSGEMNAENVLEIARPGARRADGGVRRRGPGALSATSVPDAGDGDDLARSRRPSVGELEVGGRDPPGAEQLARASSRAAPTSSRRPTRTTGWSTASPVWISVSTSNSSSSVP